MSAAVEIETKVVVKDPTESHSRITVESCEEDGLSLFQQDNDRIYATKATAVALAKVILQKYGVKFEPVHQQEVDYSC